MGFGECKACEAYKDEIKHLRGLLDQTLDRIAPKTAVVDEPKAEEAEKDVINYGE